MTLNWSKTAPDCRVVQELTPYVVQHLVRADMKWKWINGSPLYRPNLKPVRALDQILATAADFLEDDGYWDRTRHQLSTFHGIYRIRNLIERKFDGLFYCLCGCRR